MDAHPLLSASAPFTLAAARAAGLDDERLRRALRKGSLRRVCRGAYVAAAVPDSVHTRALAFQAVQPRVTVSHESAAALWDVRVDPLRGDRPPLLRVTVPPGEPKPQHRGLVVAHAALRGDEVDRVRGVRVTSPGRTVADLARERGLVDAVVVADAFTHVWPKVLRDLEVQAGRCPTGARGAAVLRQVATHVEWLTESPLESRLRMVLVLAGLPRPVAQHVVRIDGRFVARLDLAYPELRLGIEYDGREAHPVGLAADRRRARALAAADWVVLHFTAEDVLREPGRTVSEVTRMRDLQARRQRERSG